MNTDPRQAPQTDSERTYQGRNVLAVQRGTCMHCKADLTSLLVNLAAGRRWVSVDALGKRNVEHECKGKR